MQKSQDLTWSQLAMAANTPMLTKASMVDGRPEVGILPTGQVVGVIDELPTVAELIDRIMAEADDGPRPPHRLTLYVEPGVESSTHGSGSDYRFGWSSRVWSRMVAEIRLRGGGAGWSDARAVRATADLANPCGGER